MSARGVAVRAKIYCFTSGMRGERSAPREAPISLRGIGGTGRGSGAMRHEPMHLRVRILAMIRMVGLAWLMWLILPTSAFATGWTDYEIDIGDGYSIVRPYYRCHALVVPNGEVRLISEHLPGVAGFQFYSVTPTSIYLKCLIDSGTPQAVNPARVYLIVSKQSFDVSGLLTVGEFAADPAVIADPPRWKAVRNPLFEWLMGFGLVLLCVAVGTIWIAIFRTPSRGARHGVLS
jgi:hypothetical protein